MQDQKSWTLRWRLFLSVSNDVITCIVSYKHCQYFNYVSQWRSLFFLMRLTRPKIIEAPLMHISKMGQPACRLPFYLEKHTTQSLWNDVTMQPFDWWKCMTENHWRSVDTHVNDMLTVIVCSTIVFKNVYNHYCQPIKHWNVKSSAF